MGRPIKKVSFGTAAGSDAGILVSAMKTDTARTSYIVKQVGSNKYYVYNATDGQFKVKLDDGTTFAADTAETAVMIGYTDQGDDSSRVAIRKLFQKTAVDFSGNRYKWELQNDSSADVIVLTAI